MSIIFCGIEKYVPMKFKITLPKTIKFMLINKKNVFVFGFIIGFFIMEFIVVRVKAVKKAKSMPTLKKQEGDNNGNTN